MATHVDDEKCLDTSVPITSLSFCEDSTKKRRFYVMSGPVSGSKADHAKASSVRSKTNACKVRLRSKSRKVHIPLGHGDVFTGPLGTHAHGLMGPLKGKGTVSVVFTFRMLKKPVGFTVSN